MLTTKKAARDFAYSLVSDGKKSFNLLDDTEKQILSAYLFESLPLVHIYEPISDADHKNEIPHLLALYMKSGNEEYASEILRLLVQNAVTHFSMEIDEILEEQEDELEFNRKYDK